MLKIICDIKNAISLIFEAAEAIKRFIRTKEIKTIALTELTYHEVECKKKVSSIFH